VKFAWDVLASGVKSLDPSTFLMAIPIAGIGVWLLETSVAWAGTLFVASILLSALMLRGASGRLRRPGAGVLGVPDFPEVMLPRGDSPGSASSPVGSSDAGPTPAPQTAVAQASAVAAGAVEPGIGPVAGTGTPAPGLAWLRTRMDEVDYTSGDPNVLSMTKYVGETGAPADVTQAGQGPTAPAAGARWSREDAGDETVLRLEGVVDVFGADEVRTAFDAVAADRRRSVTLDLSRLRAIDSTGAGTILGLVKRVRAHGGTVRLTGTRGQPLAVLRLLRLELVAAFD
jgi:anti-sigma B factor antagonist